MYPQVHNRKSPGKQLCKVPSIFTWQEFLVLLIQYSLNNIMIFFVFIILFPILYISSLHAYQSLFFTINFLLNHFFKAKVGVTWLCQNRMRSHPCCLQVCYVVSNLHEVDVDLCLKTTLQLTDHRLYINFESNFSCTMC